MLHGLDLLFFIPILLSFISIWAGYMIIMSQLSTKRSSAKDFNKLTRYNISCRINGQTYINWVFSIGLVYWFYFICLKTHEVLLWSNHLHLSNSTFGFVLFLGFLSIAVQWCLKLFTKLENNNLGGDYAVSITQLCLYLPFLILANTALTLFFFLEAAAILIFYNFISTRSLVLTKSNNDSAITKYFFNLLFFQFWTSFFSAALILYGIINLYLFFGTTEWVYLNFLIPIVLSSGNSQSNLSILITFIVLLSGFWIKLGLAPFFSYKIEIYKGLPLTTIIFYSIIYFAVFSSAIFIFFGYYFTMALAALKVFNLFLCGFSIMLFLVIFDSQALRNFFAFSSILTATNLILVLLA